MWAMHSFEHKHPHEPTISFDGGNLDCGNGLLLLIRKHIDPLATGQLLEVLSAEPSVRHDLPSWCRLTGNELVSQIERDGQTSFLVAKGRFAAPLSRSPVSTGMEPITRPVRMPLPVVRPIKRVTVPDTLPKPTAAPPIPPLSVMGIGSWPRPRWLVQALHEFLEGRLSEEDFQKTADDGVRLAVEAQHRAGVDVVTDGEQRRDDYASFVGGRLDNCQLIPMVDLLAYVDHPQEFAAALEMLDVPATKARHPVVFGPLGRSCPLALHEFEFARRLTDHPVKVAMPGPYLLTRTMWLDCISDRAYERRELLADDIVRVLREEVHALLAAGSAMVQFDEPVLTEVVYGRAETGNRTFMCGALGSKGPVEEELEFAERLINRVVDGLPRERLALHVCRGNWTRDENAALRGDYRPLLQLLSRVHVGTLFLECCTDRAGELSAIAQLPDDVRIGVGVVNQKSLSVESVDEVVARATTAIDLFGADRVLLNPDCGFATFADNPITPAEVAEAKLKSLTKAAQTLRRRYGLPQ
jgi:5-methyltetrahydropteroyltriglutamate--homocysteine methyltransferase